MMDRLILALLEKVAYLKLFKHWDGYYYIMYQITERDEEQTISGEKIEYMLERLFKQLED